MKQTSPDDNALSRKETLVKDFKKEADIHNELAWKHHNIDPLQSLKFAQQARKYSEIAGYKLGLANSFKYAGAAYSRLHEAQPALQSYQTALNMYRELDDKRNIMGVLGNIGNYHNELCNYDKALSYLLETLKYSEEQKDISRTINTHNSLGSLYSNLEDFPTANQHFNTAMQLAEKHKDDQKLSMILNNLCLMNFNTRQDDEALKCGLRSLRISKRIGHKRIMATALSNIGMILVNRQQYKKAIEYFERSRLLKREMSDKFGEATSLINMASVYRETENFHRAQRSCQDALDLAEQAKKPKLLLATHKLLSDIYFDRQNFEKAYFHLEKSFELKDEVLDIEKQRIVMGIQVKYDFEKALAAQEQLRRMLLESEHKTLRAQINPHFLANTMNSIQYFLIKNDTDSAQRYLSKFSRLMRRTLDNSRQSFIPLKVELECLELYVEFEHLRHKDQFSYKFLLDETLNVNDILVPTMILQPFVENAIRHGLLPKETTGELCITVTRRLEKENEIQCLIEDNGIGRRRSRAIKAQQFKPNHKSSGVRLIQERLHLISKSSGKDLNVRIIDIEEPFQTGTRVEFTLPTDMKNEEGWH